METEDLTNKFWRLAGNRAWQRTVNNPPLAICTHPWVYPKFALCWVIFRFLKKTLDLGYVACSWQTLGNDVWYIIIYSFTIYIPPAGPTMTRSRLDPKKHFQKTTHSTFGRRDYHGILKVFVCILVAKQILFPFAVHIYVHIKSLYSNY